MDIVFRSARPDDAARIFSLVDEHARRGLVLPRQLSTIQENIDNWLVAGSGEEILACAWLCALSPTLSEIRSLVVSDGLKGNGLGSKLVLALISNASRKGVRTLLALTRSVSFFERVGFKRVDRSLFPEKVWNECVICPFRLDCDEEAVAIHFGPANETSCLSMDERSGSRMREAP